MSFADDVADADRAVIGAVAGDEVITYTPEGGAAAPIVGVFDAQFVLELGDAHAGVEGAQPAVFFRLSELPVGVDVETDTPTITVDGVAYEVTSRHAAGMGSIVLMLRKIPTS